MTPLPVAYRIAASVPPGDHIIGFYPYQLFRIDELHLPALPGVAVVRGGQRVPCDGRAHQVQGHERTVCLGSFIALHVHNETNKATSFNAVLLGKQASEQAAEGELVFGAFVNEANPPLEASPSPAGALDPDPYGIEYMPPAAYDEFARHAPDEVLGKLAPELAQALRTRKAELARADAEAAAAATPAEPAPIDGEFEAPLSAEAQAEADFLADQPHEHSDSEDAPPSEEVVSEDESEAWGPPEEREGGVSEQEPKEPEPAGNGSAPEEH